MFKERIKQLRKEAGLTQDSFAKDLGVSTGTIAMWETGKRNPSYDMMLKLSKYFEVNFAELEDEPNALNHDLIDKAEFLDSLPQLYDAEKLITTILSLDDESRKKIESLVRTLEMECKQNRTLKDVRNIYADIRIDPRDE